MVTSCVLAQKGPSAKASEEDQERTRRLADAEMHRHHLESLLDQRDREITALREVTARRWTAPGPCYWLKVQENIFEESCLGCWQMDLLKKCVSECEWLVVGLSLRGPVNWPPVQGVTQQTTVNLSAGETGIKMDGWILSFYQHIKPNFYALDLKDTFSHHNCI